MSCIMQLLSFHDHRQADTCICGTHDAYVQLTFPGLLFELLRTLKQGEMNHQSFGIDLNMDKLVQLANVMTFQTEECFKIQEI